MLGVVVEARARSAAARADTVERFAQTARVEVRRRSSCQQALGRRPLGRRSPSDIDARPASAKASPRRLHRASAPIKAAATVAGPASPSSAHDGGDRTECGDWSEDLTKTFRKRSLSRISAARSRTISPRWSPIREDLVTRRAPDTVRSDAPLEVFDKYREGDGDFARRRNSSNRSRSRRSPQ